MDRAAEPARSSGAPAELAAGTRIGRYVVEQRLGGGGMGVVYAALDTELGRDVALKIVRPMACVDAMQARLRREAKAMARLSHSNVVPVFDIGTHDGQLFVAMELVAGETLRAWVIRPRPWRSVVRLFASAGRGLEAAHAAGLVHRDFKPDNVMVGPGDEPRITDFGLARELDDDAGATTAPGAATAPGMPELPGPGHDGELSRVTATGSLAGTPPYMAPEQLLGGRADPRADQFSFCVALFEVLHGARPFHTSSPRSEALVAEIRAGRIARPGHRRGVPGWLSQVIVRGLAFDPDDRWPSMRALVGALDSGLGRGRRRRWLVASGLAAAAAIAVAAAGLSGRDRSPPPSCREAVAGGNDAVTILVCKDAYTRTADPGVGVDLANALRRAGQLEQAAAVAGQLLATPVKADALYTLGKVAADEGRPADAERSLRLAGELHRGQAQWAAAATDLLALVGVSGDVVDRLAGLDQAMIDAHRGGDARVEAYCHIGAARELSEIGAGGGALAELERARSLLAAPSDRVRLDFELGNVQQNLDDHVPAVIAFERALAGAEAGTIARMALSVRLNLAYSLAEAGRLPDATAQLAAAAALDPRDRKLAERLSLEARIAAHAGDPARAAGLVERSIAATGAAAGDGVGEDLIEREQQRAEIALQQADLAGAEHWARRAIARIEALRPVHPPAEARGWLVRDRRAPYEVLFASLAHRGDAAGALAVFDRHRGAAVLAGLASGDGAAPVPVAGPGTGIAFPAADLARLFPALATSPLATPPPEAAIREAARAGSLLVLVVARGEVWRITAESGRLGIDRIGPLAGLRPQIDLLRVAPDRVPASVLGELLVPAELARPSDRVLHVVLDDPLAQLPVAALRVGERRLIAARPVVVAARASDLGCMARPPAPRRAVAVDRRAALLGAAPGDRLHVAGAIERDALGDALVLGDGRVRSLEIAGHGGSAAQVVLAVSGAEAGRGGAGALAMAFVAAGADQVIAPVRPVSAAALARLADRLQRADPTDLVRALARLQAGADRDDDDWLGFAAFGRAACNPPP